MHDRINQSNITLSSGVSYFTLTDGAQQPNGPFHLDQIITQIQQAELKTNDYLFCEHWEFWKPISEVFDLNSVTNPNTNVFQNEGQDPYVASESFKYINAHALKGEELYYIAVQHMPALKITSSVKLSMPKSIILTNHRFCILEPKMRGEPNFDTYPVQFVEKGLRKIKQGKKSGAFSIALRSGNWIEVSKIPTVQLDKLCLLSKKILDENSLDGSSSSNRGRAKSLAAV